MVPDYRITGAIPFKQAMAQGAAQAFMPVALSARRHRFSAVHRRHHRRGQRRGARHGNICANMMQGAEWIQNQLTRRRSGYRRIAAYHVFAALTVNLMIFMQAGARILLITNPRDMKSFIGDLKNTKSACLSA